MVDYIFKERYGCVPDVKKNIYSQGNYVHRTELNTVSKTMRICQNVTQEYKSICRIITACYSIAIEY